MSVTVAHFLRGKLLARVTRDMRLFFDPLLPGDRRLAIFALERAVERSLAVEPDSIGDVGGVLLLVAKHVRRDPHPPFGAVPHRGFAEQRGKALPEDRARNSCLPGKLRNL